MAWIATCDTASDDPLVLKGGFELFGFVTACASWSARMGGDGKVPDYFVPDYKAVQLGAARWEALTAEAVAVGWWTKPKKVGGDRGWFLTERGRQVLNILSHEQVQTNRSKRGTTRQKEAVREVRLRDGDRCRYCGKAVDWLDRVSGMSGTYDHPIPSDRATFVVACKTCNSSKGQRTPEQWMADMLAAGTPELAHPLGPVPERPVYGPQTAERYGVPETALQRAQEGAAPQRSASAQEAAAAGATGLPAAPGPICDLPSQQGSAYPSRAGTGRDGQPDQPVRAGPPRRTRRGSRGGTNRPPNQGDEKD